MPSDTSRSAIKTLNRQSGQRLRIDRRSVVFGGLSLPALAGPLYAGKGPIPIADMHIHHFFGRRNRATEDGLDRVMARAGATLVSWSVVGDMPWLRLTRGGIKPKRQLPTGTQPVTWLREEVKRAVQYLHERKLKLVTEASQVAAAISGEPHIVLSVEGATFAEQSAREIATAHALGVRQIQLVHYLDSAMADIQTSKPRHNGLTELGAEVIKACEKSGILVDLAHCSDAAARDALSVAKVPLIWSHSSVVKNRTPNWRMPVTRSRQLRFETARMIADRGGVIGLWALGGDVGTSPASYAKRMAEMANWLGEDHVAFGSDLNALARPALRGFQDHRRVLDILKDQKIARDTIRKIAIGNYARVLTAALR